MKLRFRGENTSGAFDQRGLVPRGEIRRKQNRPARRAEPVRALQQGGKVALEAEGLARTAASECGRVENDRIKCLPAFDEATEEGGDILGNKTMSFRRNPVQLEIPSAPLQGRFGNIHADRLCPDAGCRHREGAGVGKGIQHTPGTSFPQKKAVYALVWKKPRRVAGAEVQLVEKSALAHRFKRRGLSVATKQNRRVLLAGISDEMPHKDAFGIPARLRNRVGERLGIRTRP